MAHNRDRLRRTRDGLYEVGVYIKKDKHDRFVAQVLVALKGDLVACEVVTGRATALPADTTFEAAAERSFAWALEHVPRVFQVDPGELKVELLDRPLFV